MKVRFNLKSKKISPSLILLKIHLPNERLPFTLSTSQFIPVEFWDDITMRAKPVKAFKQSTWLNALLDKYEQLALDCIRRALVETGHLPTKNQLKQAITNEFHAQTPIQSFTTFFDTYVTRMESDPRYSYHTTKMFRLVQRNLGTFAKATRKPLTFAALDEDWFDAWQNWNFSNDLSRNTVAGYWRKFKVILNAATEQGLYKGKAHRRRNLAVSFQKADEVFLSSDELMSLYHLDLAGSHLETVRDIFLLDAFSGGFRFEDLSNLGTANIVPLHNVKTLKIHARKTDTAVYAPAGWFLEEFLEKYKGNWPKMKTGQVFNRQIKEVCRMAGITNITELRKNKGGEDFYLRKEKCDLVTQYTARYSFATNLYLAGVELKKISILLGHSNTKTTETYIKAQQLQTVMSMADNPYFITKPAKGGH